MRRNPEESHSAGARRGNRAASGQGRCTLSELVVIEPMLGGHHAEHIISIAAEAAVRMPGAVSLVLHPGFDTARLPARFSGPVHHVAETDARLWSSGPLYRRSFQQLRLIDAWVRKTASRMAFVMDMDHLQLALSLDRRAEGDWGMAGVLFRPRMHFGWHRSSAGLTADLWAGLRQRILYQGMFTCRRLRGVLTFDPFFAEYAATRSTWSVPVVSLPDPLPGRPCGAAAGGARSAGRLRWVLAGALSRRKGVLTLLGALLLLPREVATRISVKLVGSLHDDARAEAGSLIERVQSAGTVELEVVDAWVSEDALAESVLESDVVLLPYLEFVGSSGVLSWAAWAGKPVLSTSDGLIGRLVERYGLGRAVDVSTPERLAAAMVGMAAGDPKACLDPEGLARFRSERTRERFRSAIFEHIEAWLG